MTEKKHDRAADQTAVTFSLPKALKDQIEAAAAADRRSKSNWIVLALEQILAGRGEDEDSVSASASPAPSASSPAKKAAKAAKSAPKAKGRAKDA